MAMTRKNYLTMLNTVMMPLIDKFYKESDDDKKKIIAQELYTCYGLILERDHADIYHDIIIYK
jgi:hypothetical protein